MLFRSSAFSCINAYSRAIAPPYYSRGSSKILAIAYCEEVIRKSGTVRLKTCLINKSDFCTLIICYRIGFFRCCLISISICYSYREFCCDIIFRNIESSRSCTCDCESIPKPLVRNSGIARSDCCCQRIPNLATLGAILSKCGKRVVERVWDML